MENHRKSSFGAIGRTFLCISCKERDILELAQCYCETCVTFYCGQCAFHHDQLFNKHIKYGRQESMNWPVSNDLKSFIDLLQLCEKHTNKRLRFFCDDHTQLCCSTCVISSHRKCVRVSLNSVEQPLVDVTQLFVKLRTIPVKLKELHTYCESSLKDLKFLFHQQEKKVWEMHTKIYTTLNKIEKRTLNKTPQNMTDMVKHMHREIRSALDKIEEITLKETKETLSSLQVSLNTYADTCIRIHIELKHLHEALEYSNIINQTKLSFITRWKCTEIIKQVESDLNENLVKLESSLLNQTMKDTQQHLYKLSRLWRSVENVEAERNQYNSDIYQYLSRLSGLGSIVLNNYAFSVKGKSEYNMRKSRDLDRCWISGICTLPNGHTLVADWTNNKVKLLDQHCKVLSYCSVANFPRDICPITVSKTVVTVNDDDRNRHDAQFIKVKKGKLMTGRKIQLQHVCKGIAHHQGDLFITSDTAVYKYTLDGNLVSKLYEDTSDSRTVFKCAVSPKGDILYITNYHQDKLLTLAKDETFLATFSDPELRQPRGVHVTPAGQVLVCGMGSHTIIQVDSQGKRKLATLATMKDELLGPYSVCFNSNTSTIIVGQYNCDGCNNIIVFYVQ